MDDAGAVVIFDLVFVDWTAHRPADFSPLLILGLFNRLFRQGDYAQLQMFETGVAERGAQSRDEMVELAIVIVEQCLERAISQFRGVAFGRFSQPLEVAHAFAKNPDHGSAAIVAARENRGGQPHEAPHEFERFFGIGFRDVIDDCAPLGLEILHETASILPIDERA